MNITANWWAACHEDGLSIWDYDVTSLKGTWRNTTGGDYIGRRNQAGQIAVINNQQKVKFLTSGFVTVTSVTLTPTANAYDVIAGLSDFYTVVDYGGTFEIRQYSSTGVYSTNNWTITGTYERTRGAILNGQKFYWGDGDTVLAWDLNTDTALPDLITLTGFTVKTMLATADGRIAVIWTTDDTNRPNRFEIYNTDGSLYAQIYNGDDVSFIGLSLTNNWANYQIWVSRISGSGDTGILFRLDYTAGVFTTITTVEAESSFSSPTGSEFGFLSLVTGSGQIGGMYKLTKDLKHDEIWTGEDSYSSIKKPDPYATTALFGDE